jgi:hypothetical protein
VNLIEFKKYLDIYRAHEENEQEMNEELRLEILRLTQKGIFIIFRKYRYFWEHSLYAHYETWWYVLWCFITETPWLYLVLFENLQIWIDWGNLKDQKL